VVLGDGDGRLLGVDGLIKPKSIKNRKYNYENSVSN
jgi:hypothetical protein